MQRFDAWPQDEPFEDENGEYVRYDDAQAEITRLTAERDAALARAGAAAMDMREQAATCTEWTAWGERRIPDPISTRIRVLPIASDAQAALDKLIREAEQRGQIKAGGVFADTDPEARYIEDMQNACPVCEGSGHNDDAQAALDKLISDARAEAFRDAAELVKKHPMRFAGQTEEMVRATLSNAIIARINEPQEGGK